MSEVKAVLRAMTPEAREALQADEVQIGTFPFRVGRESRISAMPHEARRAERRKHVAPPNNDLYLIDHGHRMHVSRAHFQIERVGGGRFELVDRGSACGTIVDGRLVGGDDSGGRCVLNDGDVIVVGRARSPYSFKFSVVRDAE